MALQILTVDTLRPRTRQLTPVAAAMAKAAVIALPGDSGYILVCLPHQGEAVKRMRDLRKLPSHHNLTLLCPGLSSLGEWARVDTPSYRLMRRLVPGPYTFIVAAGKEAPKKIQQPKRRTMGLRFPRHPLLQTLMQLCDSPLVTTTLALPDSGGAAAEELSDVEAVCANGVAYLLSAGDLACEPTTIIDLSVSPPELLRQGAGDTSELF